MPDHFAAKKNVPGASWPDDGSHSLPEFFNDIAAIFPGALSETGSSLEDALPGRSGASSFNELFRRLRSDKAAGGTDYKQVLTNIADQLQIDWEGLLRERTWKDLHSAEIEDAIVVTLFQNVCTRLSKEKLQQLGEELKSGGMAPDTAADIISGGTFILRRLNESQLQLVRRLAWNLSKSRPTAFAGQAALTTKSAIFADVEILGSLSFKGELYFDGKLSGGSVVGDILVLGENVRINGDVIAESLKLSGKIEGNVSALQKCELDSSAELTGSLETPRLAMADGATLVGRVHLGGPGMR